MRSDGNKVNGEARSIRFGRAAPSPRQQPVWLEYHSEAAREVRIAGSFNRWNPEITGMVRVERGRWLRVLFLQPGRYEYVFVVDGVCVADPSAESVPNVYGCMNSALTVPAGVSRNGCKRRMPGRRPPGSLRTSAQLKSRLHRNANAPRRRLAPA